MRKILAVILGGLVAALAIACTSAPGDKVTGTGQGEHAVTGAPQATKNLPQGAKKFAVGEHGQLTLGDGSTADIVVASVKVQGKSVVATVTIQCTAGTVSYNAFDWSATAADGTKLDPAFDITVKSELHSGDLAAGQKVTGTVAFEGSSAKGVTVSYAAGFSTLAYWVNP